MKTKIYIFENGHFGDFRDIVGVAVAEDGHGLASHVSSSIEFLKHDLGLTSDWKHDIYKKYYPDGYEVVFVEGAERARIIEDLNAKVEQRNHLL